MVTQSDVAERAGVSRRTVSNVVTGFPYVSKDVRARVLEAIEELGYVPNRAAQQLRTGRSGVIALTVPEVGVGYFGELGNLIVEEAAARGFGTVVAQTRGSRAREIAELERLLALQPDGIILSPLGLTTDDLVAASRRTSIALIGEHVADGPFTPIAIDNQRAAHDVVAHLLELGRRHIAFVGMSGDSPRFNTLRRTGYETALDAAAVSPAAVIPTADFNSSDGYLAGAEAARRIRSGEQLDALFCVTDEVAIGLIRALHDARLRIPDDVAIAGFDDISEGRYSMPRLTTVSPDKREIARRAVSAVLGEPRETSEIGYQLALRESTIGTPDDAQAEAAHQRR